MPSPDNPASPSHENSLQVLGKADSPGGLSSSQEVDSLGLKADMKGFVVENLITELPEQARSRRFTKCRVIDGRDQLGGDQDADRLLQARASAEPPKDPVGPGMLDPRNTRQIHESPKDPRVSLLLGNKSADRSLIVKVAGAACIKLRGLEKMLPLGTLAQLKRRDRARDRMAFRSRERGSQEPGNRSPVIGVLEKPLGPLLRRPRTGAELQRCWIHA